jgi:hypothetical protein
VVPLIIFTIIFGIRKKNFQKFFYSISLFLTSPFLLIIGMVVIKFGIKITGLSSGYLRDLGLRDGYIITQLNNEPAKDPKSVGQFLEKFSGRLLLEGVSPKGQPFMQSYQIR